MKKKDVYTALVSMLLLSMMLPTGMQKVEAQGTTVVYVDPEISYATIGQTFSINISITNVTDLSGWELKLLWDTTILDCVNSTINRIWYPNDFIVKDEILENYTATHGRYWGAYTLLFPASLFNGSTTLVSLTFEATGGGNCILDLYDVCLANSTGEPIEDWNFKDSPEDGYVYTVPTNQPHEPTAVSQYMSDGETVIPEGGTTPESTVVFKATVSDPDGDTVRLEIELRQIGEAFTGEPTPETISDFVPNGSQVSIIRYGLVNGDYHWRYRAKDVNGATSDWTEFGTVGNIDFSVSLPPKITGIDPSQPIASAGKQLLTILGEGFVPNSEVTLFIGSTPYPIPPDQSSFISANKIEIIAGLGTVPGLFKALVTNPVDIRSNEYPFETQSVSDEDIMKVLELALQYWTAEDAVIMTAIAGGESEWNPNVAFDEGDYPFNYMGYDSWGLWQIFMYYHEDKLGELGAPIDDPSLTAKWLLDPNNNVKAAYAVWEEADRIWGDGFRPWSAYTQRNAPNYYKNFLERVINVANQMGIIVFQCPVNVTITDDYGRVISEVENQIPGASFEYFNVTDTKIFYLPLNLTYHVQINATAYGNITIVQITPTESIYEIAFSQATFNLTSETVAEFDLQQYEANYTLSVDENGDGVIDYKLIPEVETLTTEYDIGITELVPSKTVIGQGYDLPINVTIMNYGAHTETFNITIYANMTSIMSQTITLPSGNSTTITFAWNTTSVPYGNYTISVNATIIPGETNTVDNTYICGIIKITIPGDINGDDCVDIFDLVYAGIRYGSEKGKPPSPGAQPYEPEADINGDDIIDIFDVVIIGIHYGEHA